MPTLTIKAEFVEKMERLDCYDQWISNMKAQWDYVNNHTGASTSLTSFQKHAMTNWVDFIIASFCWNSTPEGHGYWSKIFNS